MSNKSGSKKTIVVDKQGRVKNVEIKERVETFNKKSPTNHHRPKPQTGTDETKGFRPKKY